MARLIRLSQIPHRGGARGDEAAARRDLRAAGRDPLAEASWAIEDAPGTYGGAEPRTYGWCLTPEAAQAVEADSLCKMPGGTQHRTLRARKD